MKQQQRRFQLELMEAIEAKVKKLIDSCFMQKEQHSNYVAIIIHVLKKNDKIQYT